MMQWFVGPKPYTTQSEAAYPDLYACPLRLQAHLLTRLNRLHATWDELQKEGPLPPRTSEHIKKLYRHIECLTDNGSLNFKATLLHAAKHVDHCCVMIGDIESGCGAHPGIADFLMIVFPQDAANEMWFT